jgi:hypothetical protein
MCIRDRQLGVDYKELAKGAIAAQERLSVVQDLAGKGFDLSDKDQEFIANLSQMKDGRMTLQVPKDVADKIGLPIETAVSDLTKTQITALKDNQKLLEQKPLEEVARDQFSAIKNIQNDVNSMANRQIRGVTPTVRKIAEESGMVKQLEEIATIGAKNAVLNKTTDTKFGEELEKVREKVKTFANNLGIGELSNDVLQKINNTINGTVEKERAKKFDEDKKKRELETRPKQDLSYNPNTILKTKIDVTFPFGYGGQPSAEQQGSYLVMG